MRTSRFLSVALVVLLSVVALAQAPASKPTSTSAAKLTIDQLVEIKRPGTSEHLMAVTSGSRTTMAA